MTTLLSMTGYGAGGAPLAGGQLSVEIRTVNARHGDVRVRAASELGDLVHAVEERVRPRVKRGRAEVQVRWEAPAEQDAGVDMARARGALTALRRLRDELAPDEPLPWAVLAAVPGLFKSRVHFDREQALAALDRACQAACDALDEMRRAEGAALARDAKQRLAILRAQVDWVEPRREAIVSELRDRLRARVDKLLAGSGARLDEGRLAQEVALLADRSDVAEEVTRLRSHCDQFEGLLAGAADGVGRRLDFLIQEMVREVNTIGSKANDAPLAHRVVEMKSELERLREQVQNVL